MNKRGHEVGTNYKHMLEYKWLLLEYYEEILPLYDTSIHYSVSDIINGRVEELKRLIMEA